MKWTRARHLAQMYAPYLKTPPPRILFLDMEWTKDGPVMHDRYAEQHSWLFLAWEWLWGRTLGWRSGMNVRWWTFKFWIGIAGKKMRRGSPMPSALAIGIGIMAERQRPDPEGYEDLGERPDLPSFYGSGRE